MHIIFRKWPKPNAEYFYSACNGKYRIGGIYRRPEDAAATFPTEARFERREDGYLLDDAFSIRCDIPLRQFDCDIHDASRQARNAIRQICEQTLSSINIGLEQIMAEAFPKKKSRKRHGNAIR